MLVYAFNVCLLNFTELARFGELAAGRPAAAGHINADRHRIDCAIGAGAPSWLPTEFIVGTAWSDWTQLATATHLHDVHAISVHNNWRMATQLVAANGHSWLCAVRNYRVSVCAALRTAMFHTD